MFDDENRFSMVGGMVVLLVTGLLIRMVMDATGDPKVVDSITAWWRWAGSHITILSWVAVGIIAIVGISTPWILMTNERFWEDNPLAKVGMAVTAVGTVISVGFLARVGWELFK